VLGSVPYKKKYVWNLRPNLTNISVRGNACLGSPAPPALPVLSPKPKTTVCVANTSTLDGPAQLRGLQRGKVYAYQKSVGLPRVVLPLKKYL